LNYINTYNILSIYGPRAEKLVFGKFNEYSTKREHSLNAPFSQLKKYVISN